MPDAQISALAEAVLEVISPDGSRRFVRIAQSPLLIGRGAETGNHIQLSDRRVSRQCAAVVYEGGRFYLEDRGQRRGLFVNGEKIESRQLEAGDVISFGLEDSYEIVFRPTGEEESLPNLLSRIESITTADSPAGGLRKLNLRSRTASTPLGAGSRIALTAPRSLLTRTPSSASCISTAGGRRRFPSSTARFSMLWPLKPPASWTTRGLWSASVNASASSRNSASRAISSRPCCRTAFAIFRTCASAAAISPATPSAAITSTSFRSAKIAPRF